MLVDYKRTESLNFRPALEYYIKHQYKQDSSVYDGDIQLLEKARKQIEYPESLTALLKYYEYLQVLLHKFPINENSLNLCFNWQNSLDSLMSSSLDLNFEISCVAFNIAVFYSRVDTDDLKRKCVYFQHSAAIFNELLEQKRAGSSLDFSTDVLGALVQFNLAQAQECFYEKGMADGVKLVTLAKLAQGASELFERALNRLNSSFEPLENTLKYNKSYFYALSHYKMAQEAVQKFQYGEQVGRLQIAHDSLAPYSAFAGFHAKFFDEIQSELASATKDNDIVYMQLVPKPQQLEIKAAVMVAPVIPAEFSESKKFKADLLFKDLIPYQIYDFIAQERLKYDEFASNYTSQVEKADLVLQGWLRKNQDSLLVVSEIPRSLQLICETVQSKGGFSLVSKNVEELNSIINNSKMLLEECSKQLKFESDQDLSMRQQFKARWNRRKSSDLIVNLVNSINELQSEIDKIAAKRLEFVEKIVLNQNIVNLLHKGTQIVVSQLPKLPQELFNSEINSLVLELESVEKSRKTIDEFPVNVQELMQLYHENKPLTKITMPKVDLVKNQQQILDRLDALLVRFNHEAFQNPLVKQRLDALVIIQNTFQDFVSLDNGINECLTRVVEINEKAKELFQKVHDFCSARDFERKDLIQQLMQSATSVTSGIWKPGTKIVFQ